MLRDGQFIKEPNIEIGAHYVPYAKPKITSDDIFMQDILSKNGNESMAYDTTGNSKVVNWIVIACIVWFGLAIFVPLLKILVEHLVG
jgi:hypothetical protein